MIKQQVYADWDVGLATAHARTTPLMLRAFAGPDFTEGVASYVEKRAPQFPALGEGTAYTF
jgi:enoyl-CoA hydratase/carnithine racemase